MKNEEHYKELSESDKSKFEKYKQKKSLLIKLLEIKCLDKEVYDEFIEELKQRNNPKDSELFKVLQLEKSSYEKFLIKFGESKYLKDAETWDCIEKLKSGENLSDQDMINYSQDLGNKFGEYIKKQDDYGKHLQGEFHKLSNSKKTLRVMRNVAYSSCDLALLPVYTGASVYFGLCAGGLIGGVSGGIGGGYGVNTLVNNLKGSSLFCEGDIKKELYDKILHPENRLEQYINRKISQNERFSTLLEKWDEKKFIEAMNTIVLSDSGLVYETYNSRVRSIHLKTIHYKSDTNEIDIQKFNRFLLKEIYPHAIANTHIKDAVGLGAKLTLGIPAVATGVAVGASVGTAVGTVVGAVAPTVGFVHQKADEINHFRLRKSHKTNDEKAEYLKDISEFVSTFISKHNENNNDKIVDCNKLSRKIEYGR